MIPFFQIYQPVKVTKNYKLIKKFIVPNLCLISVNSDSRYIRFYIISLKCHPVNIFVTSCTRPRVAVARSGEMEEHEKRGRARFTYV
jgi:hypothetical protein